MSVFGPSTWGGRHERTTEVNISGKLGTALRAYGMEMQRERRQGRLRRSTSGPSSIEGFTVEKSVRRASVIELDKGKDEK